MGTVSLCFDHEEQRPVAPKTFKPEYLPDIAAQIAFRAKWTLGLNSVAIHILSVRYSVQRVGDGTKVCLVFELIAKERGPSEVSLRSCLTPGHPLLVDQTLLFALRRARCNKRPRRFLDASIAI